MSRNEKLVKGDNWAREVVKDHVCEYERFQGCSTAALKTRGSLKFDASREMWAWRVYTTNGPSRLIADGNCRSLSDARASVRAVTKKWVSLPDETFDLFFWSTMIMATMVAMIISFLLGAWVGAVI